MTEAEPSVYASYTGCNPVLNNFRAVPFLVARIEDFWMVENFNQDILKPGTVWILNEAAHCPVAPLLNHDDFLIRPFPGRLCPQSAAAWALAVHYNS